MSFGYYFEDDLDQAALLGPVVQAEDRIGRLDERLARSIVAEGVTKRALFREAVARMWIEGELVHLADLVLLDDGSLARAPDRELSHALHILLHWKAASAAPAPRSILLAAQPGVGEQLREAQRNRPEELYASDWNEAGRMTEWRTAVRATEPLPPTLAAAVAMDAWLALAPEQRGQWRASLLGSLVLKMRGKTAFLLPISWGGQKDNFRWQAKLSINARLKGLLGWMATAAEKMDEETDKLTLAHEILSGQLENCRKNSRLPMLAELLVNSPVISIPMAAQALRATEEAVRQMLQQLGSTPREMTGRSSFRVWGLVQGL